MGVGKEGRKSDIELKEMMVLNSMAIYRDWWSYSSLQANAFHCH